jgi:hypothetical protein
MKIDRVNIWQKRLGKENAHFAFVAGNGSSIGWLKNGIDVQGAATPSTISPVGGLAGSISRPNNGCGF